MTDKNRSRPEDVTMIAFLRQTIANAVQDLGAPTMDYAPEVALREYRQRVDRVTGVLLEAHNRSTSGKVN